MARKTKPRLGRGLSGLIGEPVQVINKQQQEIGRGLAHYKADDLQAICGHRSQQIAGVLGFDYGPTAIHRDNLVIV